MAPRQRVVLARIAPETMVGLQWTGQEPAGLFDVDLARGLGAGWEGDELVTYDLPALIHEFDHWRDEYLTDPD